MGPRPANRSIVRRNGRTTAKQLPADDIALTRPRQRPNYANNPDRKLLRPQFHGLGLIQRVHRFPMIQ